MFLLLCPHPEPAQTCLHLQLQPLECSSFIHISFWKAIKMLFFGQTTTSKSFSFFTSNLAISQSELRISGWHLSVFFRFQRAVLPRCDRTPPKHMSLKLLPICPCMDLTSAENPPHDTPAASGGSEIHRNATVLEFDRFLLFILLLHNIYLKDAGTTDFTGSDLTFEITDELIKCDESRHAVQL